jgi:enoyl-CoA hydratase/carnithine racemase
MVNPPAVVYSRAQAEAFELVRFRVAEHIAFIRLNRPEQRNALNLQAYAELESCLRIVSDDADIRCVVVGATDPAFCSGDDVREILASSATFVPATPPARPAPTPAALAALECAKPMIAAVNGAAVGWGMELALYADIRIASERAKFAELFIKRGLVCDVGGFVRLPAIVGPAKAAELLFTGDSIDAAEALRIGLVSAVVKHEELDAAAVSLATRIAQNPPLALTFMKEGLRRATLANGREMGGWVTQTLHTLMKTDDHREGVASFLEKRAPRFSGR